MKQEHHPEQLKPVHKGVNKHISIPAAADVEDGSVYDSLNMSPNIPGFYGSRKKIEGETLVYDNDTELTGYTSLGSARIVGDIVEIWGGEDDGVIRVNGVIRCQSEDLPLRNTDLINFDTNENVIGGEIYINNRRTAPFIFSIEERHSVLRYL